MEIRYKVIGSRRKQMAHKIAEITGQECRYLYLPTYAYEIGDFTLAKDGTLTIADTADENEQIVIDDVINNEAPMPEREDDEENEEN